MRRILGSGSGHGAVKAIAVVAVAAQIVACSTAPRVDEAAAAAPGSAAASPAPGSTRPGAAGAPFATGDAIDRPRGRWTPASWADLPGWRADRVAEALPSLLRSCERPAATWLATCADLRRDALALLGDDGRTRAWLEARLVPWRIEATDGQTTGLATGYFEPLLEASRTSQPNFRVPLYAPPPDLATRKPYWTRRELETAPAARRSVAAHAIAWLRDPLDALLIQVQGSGRVAFAPTPGFAGETVRLAFAAHNGEPYKSVGRWLVERGELTLDQASWPAIRAWAKRNPRRVDELMWSNPRVVFFREEPLPDPSAGPKGAQGVPLTPGRSIAVDPGSVPYGTPVWIDTTEPLSTTPLRRLVVAQDTGTAITGAVRADYFWGWGDAAQAQAGRMKQPLRMWVLRPR